MLTSLHFPKTLFYIMTIVFAIVINEKVPKLITSRTYTLSISLDYPAKQWLSPTLCDLSLSQFPFSGCVALLTMYHT